MSLNESIIVKCFAGDSDTPARQQTHNELQRHPGLSLGVGEWNNVVRRAAGVRHVAVLRPRAAVRVGQTGHRGGLGPRDLGHRGLLSSTRQD